MDNLDPLRAMEDAATMLGFQKSHEYDRWKFYMEAMIADSKDRAVQKGSGDWEKGIVEGLKLALQVPEKVILLGKQAAK